MCGIITGELLLKSRKLNDLLSSRLKKSTTRKLHQDDDDVDDGRPHSTEEDEDGDKDEDLY